MKDVKLYVLDNGWMEGDQNHMTAMAVMGTIHNRHPRKKWGRWPVSCYLIEHPTVGKILFDVGCNPKTADINSGYHPTGHLEIIPYYCRKDQMLEHQLKRTGTKKEEIKTIICSHTHYDHMGNLRLFPGADVYVPRADYEYAQRMFAAEKDPEKHISYVKKDFEAEVNWHMLPDADFTFAEGIDVIHVPGHCPDCVALVLELEREGTVILAQDAVSSRFVFGPPARQTTYVYDTLSWYRSIEKVREIAERTGGRVFFSHDWKFFEGLKKAPNYYE
ncbi:MAG: N-acyl homoserine lactonase family protein [Eubacteriales bacterium]|nr:N-acyl homoserine lactonase family protein [Eubacteriales bacterium]